MNLRKHRHICLSPAQSDKHGADDGHVFGERLPDKPPEMSWRDYLIMLLHIGAELEHMLMVEYLFTAYSITDEHVPEAARKEVHDWRDNILTVAKEEMGHLLTVQNLICLLGGPITFDREDVPWDSAFYPVPFRLEKISLDSIACYVFAEMPKDLDLKEHRKRGTLEEKFVDHDYPQIIDIATRRAAAAGRKLHTVGEVYELILEIVANKEHIPEWVFRAETVPYQASWDDWGRGYKPAPARPGETSPPAGARKSSVIIEQMATRTEVVATLRAVAGQGEAAHLQARAMKEEHSHFDRFAKIFRGMKEHPDWDVARNIPDNPSTIDPAYLPVGSTAIESPVAKLWAALFNLRYRILLSYLAHTFRISRTVDPNVPNVRGPIMHRIFGEMYNIKSISGILVQLPLTDEPGETRMAGPPFQMPYTLALPLDEIDCWRLHRDILHSSMELSAHLLDAHHRPSPRVTPQAEGYLKTLLDLDTNTMKWIMQVQEGIAPHGRHHS